MDHSNRLEELIDKHENTLFRAALAILGDVQEAEDAVQDAFVTYLEKAPGDLENPAAWLMRVLVNGCKSRLRLAWRQVAPLPDTLPAPSPEEREELEELSFRLAERRAELADEREDWERRREERLAQARRQLEEWRSSMDALLDKPAFGHRRLLRAFPRLRSSGHQTALERLRRRIGERK